MKLFQLICMLLLLAVTMSARAQPADNQRPPIRVRGDDSYPPYEFADDQGRPTGFNIDMIRAVAEVMGLTTEVRMGPWNQIRQALEAGNIDVLSGMYYSEERARQVGFSTPHIMVSHSVFVRKGSPIRTLADIKGKEIIVQKGDIMYDFVMEHDLSDNIYAVENQKDALRLLNSGRHDCALLARLQGLYNAHRFDLNNVEAVGPPIQSRKYCFAVRKGNYELLAQLNEGLSILRATGRYEKIYSEWFGVYEQKSFFEKALKYVFWIAGPLAMGIMLTAFWFRTLRRQVALKTRALQRSEETLRQIMDLVPHIICARDRTGRFILANRAAALFYGTTADKLMKTTLADVIADADVLANELRDDAEVISGNAFRFHGEEIRQDRAGNPRRFQTTKIPFRDEDEEAVLMVSVDITELRQAEAEKKKLMERLARSQKMEALGLLAGGVAHDLNNVLSGIVSYPDLLLMDLPGESPLRRPILTIRESGQKAAAIVQDLLTLARRGVFNHEVVDLNALIAEYLSSPEHEKLCACHADIQIETALDAALFNIKGSPVHLKKTLMNLVSNAAEARPSDGKILITTRNRYPEHTEEGDGGREGEFVILSVEDRGIGIDEEDLDRIFEPFYTKKVMGRSGTGLGMAVVWGTVQDHDGFITVDSVRHKGTVFELCFPAVREAVVAGKGECPIETYAGAGESVLVVDDVREQRDIASAILRKLNYEVTAVPSGEAAVEYLKAQAADLVLLDMVMTPGMDGLETYAQILRIRPGQKAIIVSGFAETSRVKEAQRLGAGEYVRKPYTMESIGMAVRQELDRKQNRAEDAGSSVKSPPSSSGKGKNVFSPLS